MKEFDVLPGGEDLGSEANERAGRALSRRVIGRIFLAMSVLLIVASSGHRANAAGDDRASGAEIFKQNGCEHCHGADGVGTDRGPSLSTIGKRMKRNEIEHQIREGGKQMPPFQDVLNDDQIRQLVDYLAHKKKTPKLRPGS